MVSSSNHPALHTTVSKIKATLWCSSIQGYSISAQGMSLTLRGFAVGQRLAPLFHDSFDILIEETEEAIRPCRMNQRRG